MGIHIVPDEETGGGLLRRLARASGRSPVWLHVALLLATIATTIYAGAFLLQTGGTASLGQILAAGGPFALTLLLILGVHEMGHYVAARYHRVKVTLPYFIPLPIPGSLGTLGATIFIRSPLQTRRVLFDVGISGPLAGLAVALPLFVIGLLLPPIAFGAPITMSFRGVGTPPLLDWLGSLVVTEGSLSRAILLHPVALAAWFGVLLTALNLLPLGQFDGGHVAYALVGRLAWGLAGVTFFALALGGLLLWPTWLIWAFLASLTGLRHPPPHDDITPLDARRKVVGWLTVLVFALIIMPQPIIVRQGLLPSNNSNAVPLPTIAPLVIPTAQPFVIPDSPQ
jgi:membrane-associated protease RseP (regulator of RpoE activity)